MLATGNNPPVEVFAPKLISALREGYSWRKFADDSLAGLTVAIVALPLAMAIAIASGTTPERGLYTAIVAGFLISLLGGSRYQVGGPTAAFIVVVYATIERHGFDGLLLATLMAGIALVLIGLLRLGTYIKYIPYPVVVGFTAGIAVSIFLTQVRDLLGLQIDRLPAEFLGKIQALWAALPSADVLTIGVSAASLGLIIVLRRYRPTWPAFLIAVGLASLAVAAFGSGNVATIGSQFGGVPRTLPSPSLPEFSLDKVVAVLPDAFTIMLLAGIESLLSAVIADGMTGRRHRSNTELIAQGIANIASVLFGGISATGALARTATNIRSGARTPVAGILHAAFLLIFMAVAAPVLSYIPLAALGAVLAVVAWTMSDHNQFISLVRASWSDRVVVLLTFALTVFYDLTVALQVGVVLAVFIFMHRMANAVRVTPANGTVEGTGIEIGDDQIAIYRIDGPLFFGAATRVSDALEAAGTYPRAYIIDFSAVPLADSTAASALHTFVAKARAADIEIFAANCRPQVWHVLLSLGLGPPMITHAGDLKEAIAAARASQAERTIPA